MEAAMTALKPGRPLPINETYAMVAQARRLRSVYLRIAFRRLVLWLTARWAGARAGSASETSADTGPSPDPRAASVTQFPRRPSVPRPLPSTDISHRHRLQTGTSAR
jgi:hypothetical protein